MKIFQGISLVKRKIFVDFSRALDKYTQTGYNNGMEKDRIITPIAYIRSDFKEKFGIPRQSGRAPSLVARVVLIPPFNDEAAVRGIESFSHLWILFDFSQTREKGWSATVRPPRLGGNERVGVFASRSPFRPNHIGLSCVKLERVEYTKTKGAVLVVSGADLLDGTPIFDIKPYLSFADCKPQAIGGYADEHKNERLEVAFDEKLLALIPKEKRAGLCECLADDPRPSYQDDPHRVYGMKFDRFNIKFTVQNGVLNVVAVEQA